MDEVEELIELLRLNAAKLRREHESAAFAMDDAVQALTVSPEKLSEAGRQLNEVYQRHGQGGDLRTAPLPDDCAIALARAAAIALGLRIE